METINLKSKSIAPTMDRMKKLLLLTVYQKSDKLYQEGEIFE